MTEHNFYKNGGDVSWNWGDGFYIELGEYKKGFRYCYLNKLAYNWLLNIRAEWLHVGAYLLSFKEEVDDFKSLVDRASKLLNNRQVGGRIGEEKKAKKEEEAILLLYEAQEILNSLEAQKGMLQPKSDDPIKKLRKYGD